MAYISGSEEKRRIAEKEPEKLQEEINARAKELGLRGLQPLQNQSQYQQLEDLKNNSEKIKEQMGISAEERKKKRKQEFEDSRYKRWKEAERRYFEKKERQAKEAYEKRKITL